MGKPKKDAGVEIKGEYVKELIDWLNAKHNGRCNTSELTAFYSSHRHLNRKKLGGLRAISKKYKTMIGYESGIPCYLSTVGRLPFTWDAQVLAFEWETEACIRAEFVASVQSSNVVVNETNAAKELEFYVSREKKKSLSRENRDKLRDDPQAVEEKLDSAASLSVIANALNIAYTDCAIALLGWEFIDTERKNIDLSQSPETEDRKHQLLRSALELASVDTISGYKLSTRSEASMRKSAERGETTLESELKRVLKITDDDFITEEDVKSSLSEGEAIPLTPDVRFKTPQLILGKMCFWAEAKHSVVVPGLSPHKIIADIKRQTDKYVEAFGPGVILWTKCGFPESIRKELSPSILHAVPKAVALKNKNICHANPRRTAYHTHGGRHGSTHNNFFGAAAHNDFRYPAELLQWSIHPSHAPHPNALPNAFFPYGRFSSGFPTDWTEEAKVGRARLLDKLAEEAKIAAATRAESGALPCSVRVPAEEEDDSFTLMLTRMFTTADDEHEQLMAKLMVYVRLLRLTDGGVKALTLVGKVLQKILDEPGEDKYRAVKIVATLSNSPNALKLLLGLGFQKVDADTRISYAGKVNAVLWLQLTAAIASALVVEAVEVPKIPAELSVENLSTVPSSEPECTPSDAGDTVDASDIPVVLL